MKKIIRLYLPASLLLASAGIWGAMLLYAGQTTVPRGVTAGGLPIGGLQVNEADDLLLRESGRLMAQPITLVSQEPPLSIKADWSKAGLSLRSDALLQALDQLQEGSLWQRVKFRYTFTKIWSLEVHYDESVLKKSLNSEWEARQFGALKNAERVIKPGDQISYIPEVKALRIKWDTLGAALIAKAPRTLDAGDAGAASDADRDPGSQPVQVQLPLGMADPPVTVSSLKAQGVNRRVSMLTTRLTGASGRLHNVEAAAKIIDGMLLAPGEVFDYGKVVREAESKYGFREAPVIIQGRLVPGIGGGICQVSGTLYGAVIRAGLEVVERRSHSRPVSYLPKGQDATFSTGYINFKFKNNTSGYLLISAKAVNGTMTVKLFGSLPSGVHYEIRSKTVKTLSPGVRYVSNPALPAGLRQMLQQGTPGYVVETYRTKWTNGNPGKEELLSRDTYPAQPAVVAVRTAASDPGAGQTPPEPQIIEDGVKE
ncbi:VanW family protein [Paenibacillus pinistramenti]|uniref:VanW family protein n=1 Tax=Paenibacillus pinistramenti TaxID=1768003 RepID=UPI001109B163|nr:VanW family protein [Paenibacillus pinistramenti]